MTDHPWDYRKWSYLTGSLYSEVQMYSNVWLCYYNTGLSLEVSDLL